MSATKRLFGLDEPIEIEEEVWTEEEDNAIYEDLQEDLRDKELLKRMSEEELDAELRQERIREHQLECQSAHFDDWLSDNLNDLQSAFIEETQSDAFYEYVKEIYENERQDK